MPGCCCDSEDQPSTGSPGTGSGFVQSPGSWHRAVSAGQRFLRVSRSCFHFDPAGLAFSLIGMITLSTPLSYVAEMAELSTPSPKLL